MAAKEMNPEITEALRNAVEKLDIDGVLYRLSQIAYAKRDAEDDKGSNGNKAERRYQQKLGSFLADMAEKVNELEG